MNRVLQQAGRSVVRRICGLAMMAYSERSFVLARVTSPLLGSVMTRKGP